MGSTRLAIGRQWFANTGWRKVSRDEFFLSISIAQEPTGWVVRWGKFVAKLVVIL